MDTKALILVVDDNSEYRRLLVWILEIHGFRTISAACGLEGVELAIEFQPRLVLMDLSMPDMDGFEATEAIHTHRRGKNIPIVAVSSYCVDDGFVGGAFREGFVACLGKPWEEEALLQIVTNVLGSSLKPEARFQHSRKNVANRCTP